MTNALQETPFMTKLFFTFAALILSVAASAQTGMNPAMNDAQLTKVLLTINEGEIDAGKMAEKKAHSAQVKEFAKMMVAEHEMNVKDTKALAKNRNIGMKDSDLSKSLKDEAKTSNKDLKKEAKNHFDRAYMDQQVMMHQKALSTLDTVLIPGAQNSELKTHLQNTRKAVAMHLERAKALQAKI